MELIDKATVVVEIEKKIKSINSCPFRTAELGSEKFDEGQLNAYNEIISYLDTLEVKEVDEKSTKHFTHWKPTQEQMYDLYHAATMNSISCPSLKSLYNDLKVIAQKEK